mgnify:CR=1 FL=1
MILTCVPSAAGFASAFCPTQARNFDSTLLGAMVFSPEMLFCLRRARQIARSRAAGCRPVFRLPGRPAARPPRRPAAWPPGCPAVLSCRALPHVVLSYLVCLLCVIVSVCSPITVRAFCCLFVHFPSALMSLPPCWCCRLQEIPCSLTSQEKVHGGPVHGLEAGPFTASKQVHSRPRSRSIRGLETGPKRVPI